MAMQIPSCPFIGTFSFENNANEPARKVFTVVDLDPASGGIHSIQYVNIEFYGFTKSDGAVVISRVESAELTESNIFDD